MTAWTGRRNRKRTIRYDKDRYRGRHLIESAFCHLKDFRRVATRYGQSCHVLSNMCLANRTAMHNDAAMRATLHLLTMVCLMWCALGISEPAAAQDHGAVEIYAVDAGDPADDGTATPEPGHHQHCPVALELRLPVTPAPVPTFAVRPVAPCFPALASLTQAPPLQPPSA